MAATDGLADLSPPAVDREHRAGNHVILASRMPALSEDGRPGTAWVMVAHLREGSVRVAAGEAVAAGQPLARGGT